MSMRSLIHRMLAKSKQLAIASARIVHCETCFQRARQRDPEQPPLIRLDGVEQTIKQTNRKQVFVLIGPLSRERTVSRTSSLRGVEMYCQLTVRIATTS